MKNVEKEKLIIKNGKQLSLIFLLAVLFVLPANAALQAVGPIDPANGFPQWYMDSTGLRLGQCLTLADGTTQDPNCALVAEPADPATGFPGFNPAQPIVFPSNFPTEFFWWSADSLMDLNLTAGSSARLVLAMEGAFGGVNAIPVAGDQISFGRLRVRIINPTVAGVYTVTHPFGTTIVTVPDPPVTTTVTDDIGCIALPCDFSLALGSNIGPFLKAVNPAPPAGYIGDGVTESTVTGSPAGNNLFRVVGPAGSGIDVTKDLFVVTGRIFQVVNGTIAGTVTNASSGAAIAGATVTADGVSATTDAAGNYTISIAPGTYTVNASAAGFVTQSVPNVIVTSGNTTVQDFALTPTPVAGFTISGRVITRVRGIISGLPGVTMTLTDAGGLVVATNTTDANGAYTFTGVANGSFTVTPTLNGFRFAPPRINVIVDGADVTVRDFRGRALR